MGGRIAPYLRLEGKPLEVWLGSYGAEDAEAALLGKLAGGLPKLGDGA